MSAWVNGKLDLKCSLDVLKRAISNLFPQWADHIQIDPSGKIPMYRYNGERRMDRTVALLLPGSGNPNFAKPPNRESENDWGFVPNAEGKWDALYAEFHEKEAEQLSNAVCAEVSRMKQIAVNKLKGYQYTEKKEGNKTIIDAMVDEERARQMLGLAQME